MHLKEYIESRRFDHKEFAKMVGIHPNTLSCYIHFVKMPKLTIALRIEKITKGKVTVEDLAEYWQTKEIYG